MFFYSSQQWLQAVKLNKIQKVYVIRLFVYGSDNTAK